MPLPTTSRIVALVGLALVFAACGQIEDQVGDPPEVPKIPRLLDKVDDQAAATFFNLILDSNMQAMRFHNEAMASVVPDFQAISQGQPHPGVTEDVSRTFDPCVEVKKSADDEQRTFLLNASYRKCTDGRDGFIDAWHRFLPVEKDATSWSTEQQLIFAGFRFGHTEANGAVTWKTSYPVEPGPVVVLEEGDLEFDLDVTSALGIDDGRATVKVETTHTMTLTRNDQTGDLALDGTVTIKTQGSTGTLVVKGSWSPSSCGSGGWKEGSVKLSSGGQELTVPLSCGVLSNGAGRYDEGDLDRFGWFEGFCQGCDLKGADLSRTTISFGLLSNSDFTGAKLTSANWSWAFLDGSLGGEAPAKLTNVKASFSRIDTAFMDDVDASGSSWVHAELTNTVGHRARFNNAYFNGADLYASWFDHADFTGAYLDGAKLSSTYFRWANLTNASFLDAVADQGTSFFEAVFNNTVCPDGTNSDDNAGTCCGHFKPRNPANSPAVTPAGCD